jgi:lipopolysaccharide/colanic/teichoic acid biosynthesis glycosyltransferase
MPVLLPLMALIALAVRLTSSGPILFTQERIGLRRKPFVCFKFRTMKTAADTAVHRQHIDQLISSNRPMIKLDNRGDKRLTPIGPILRATGLDELPQLLNVIRGDMSLVGPRPCMPYEYTQYCQSHQDRIKKRNNFTPNSELQAPSSELQALSAALHAPNDRLPETGDRRPETGHRLPATSSQPLNASTPQQLIATTIQQTAAPSSALSALTSAACECFGRDGFCYKERWDTLPGLTGYWQVSGKNRTTFDEMMRLDVFYARNQSLWLDLKIIFMTIPALVTQVQDTRKAKQLVKSVKSTMGFTPERELREKGESTNPLCSVAHKPANECTN